MSGQNQNLSGDSPHMQAFLQDTTQQGLTYVPCRGGTQRRAERVAAAVCAVDHQFVNPLAAQQQQQQQQQAQGHTMTAGSGHDTAQAQGARHSRTASDLNGVGQQFHGYAHH